uniref:DNA-directed RNA polymerase II subunit RPB9-like zinc ribbon domain-containing protein n=1 Tax=Florenciella parvula TaxID=236787 RepID=A0A7S2D5P7_9STRA|mmetsp:Transcript_9520/g.20136  ORF Transcript_9520/g.20136 Transcript_9520/m.20136 type:complete len:159 (+) Transcript_9520:27-503(+)
MDDLSDDDEGVAFDVAPAGDHAAEEEEEEEMEITPDPSDPERRFCPRCGTMWGPWEDKRKKKLMLKCRNCTYKEPTENTTPVYENHIVKQLKNTLDTISPSVGQDPTLYQARIPDPGCIMCGMSEAVLFQAEAGSKANSLRLVFVCKNSQCGHKWINE